MSKFSAQEVIIWVAGTFGFVLISTVVGLMLKLAGDMATVQEQLTRVDQIEDLLDREARLETEVSHITTKIGSLEAVLAKPSAYLQLSSAKNQRGIGPSKVQMELKDAGENISFDPRRSATDITITEQGAYFTLAAPQVMQTSNDKKTGCYDLWMMVNGVDINNSNVRYCFSTAPNATDVLVAQGVACYKEGDVLSIVQSATLSDVGIDAIKPEDEPLIPSIIFSMFRVGDC